MDIKDPKWKKFEKTVYELQKQLAPDSEIKLNDSIQGIHSRIFRQIDISIRRHIAQYSILIVIDCKDHKDPIDVKTVEEFTGLLKDVQANKGAIISSSGFTMAGINYAKAHGIETFRLVDTESVDWKAYASIPVLLESTNFRGFRVIFKNFVRIPRIIEDSDIKTLNLFSLNNELLGTIEKIIAEKWNSNKIDQTPGEKQILLGEKLSLEVMNYRVHPIDVYAKIYVEKHYYFGKLPVHLKGFENLQGGGVITKELITEKIEPAKIEQGLVNGWRKIDDPKDLSVKPFISLVIKDHISI